MSGKRLGRDFYTKEATELAILLLGKYLCRRIDGKVLRMRITETECYYTEKDTACHAHKGRTDRTAPMYDDGGTVYVYLCYGIHNLMNVVTGHKDVPQAVLIRGVDGYNGPGKLTKALQIDRTLNRDDMTVSDRIWIEDGEAEVSADDYECLKRVGIDYASEEDRERLWRYRLKDGV